ncbi:MAG: zinc ribbon domain-containing protein [Candidatus Eisenbacteria sp.]|nr:zinc ribbon domain-containing protein [Candidatus Eisenbacteria bacterium]
MPLYEYVCDRCGEKWEVLTGNRGKVRDLDICPHCGSHGTRRLSTFSTHYRGSGFYRTDNRRKEDEHLRN